jgi:hypothetical protein
MNYGNIKDGSAQQIDLITYCSVFKPGPARRADPGLAKNRSVQRPGQTGGSTRDPGDPGETRPRPCFFFFQMWNL